MSPAGVPAQLDVSIESKSYRAASGGRLDVLRGLKFALPAGAVAALVGPSGCGKTTLLRSLNRLNDLIPGAAVAGRISYHGHDLNAPGVDPVDPEHLCAHVGEEHPAERPGPQPDHLHGSQPLERTRH